MKCYKKNNFIHAFFLYDFRNVSDKKKILFDGKLV